jgi:SAM-dependent methyltransferase
VSVDLATLSPALSRNDEGIWVAAGDGSRTLSFPEDGHDACFRLEDDSFWFQHRNECIFAALEKTGAVGPLLDVGGGNGAVSASLAQRGLSAVVLEPGPEGARNARKRGLDDVVCATLDEAAFAPGSFGAAGAFDVIEHVEDDVGLLRSIHRVLRPRGVLCVTVPAFQGLWSAEDEHAGHYRRYTLSQLRATLARASFDVDYATYFFAPLTLPVLVVRGLRHRIGKRSAASIDESAARDHDRSPATRRMMRVVLGPEVAMIRRRLTIPFGTSCLVVATKK